MVIVIDDLKHPERSACRILPKEEVARVWNDFEGYYREFRSDRAFNLASRTAKVDPKPVRQLLMGKCEF